MDAALEAVIRSCLELTPERRPTAAEMVERLEALASRAGAAPVPSPVRAAGTAADDDRTTLVPQTPQAQRSLLVVRRAAIGGGLACVALVAAGVAVRDVSHPAGLPITASPGVRPSELADSTTPPSAPPMFLPTSIIALDGAPMVLVSGGPYRRGPLDDTGPPRQRGELPGFYIDRDEVTNLRYRRFERETGRTGRMSYGSQSPDFDRPDHPVVGVSFDDADAYCRWAGKELPDEDHWEKAARGTDGRAFPWGDRLLPYANYRDRAAILVARARGQVRGDTPVVEEDDGWPFTAPVGSYPRGTAPCGARDMVGNVWEWCYNLHTPGARAVLRAGSFGNGLPGKSRVSGRENHLPSDRGPSIGFRGMRRGRSPR